MKKRKHLSSFAAIIKAKRVVHLKTVTNLCFGALKCYGSKIVPMAATMYLQSNYLITFKPGYPALTRMMAYLLHTKRICLIDMQGHAIHAWMPKTGLCNSTIPFIQMRGLYKPSHFWSFNCEIN